MRRLLVCFVLLLWSACSAMAQQSGDVVGISDFHAIDTRGNVHLIICQSDSSSTLTVQYNNLDQKEFKFKVRKGVLYIDVPSGLLNLDGFARVVVTTPKLEKIYVEGATIECMTPIKGEYLEFISQGSVNLATLNVQVDRLTVQTAGKSDVMVIGSATEVNLSAKFGSRIDAFRLATQTAVATSYDGSEIYVCPTLSLKAKASTAGTIYYMNTATVEPKVSLWGDVVLIERARYKPLFIDFSNSEQSAPEATKEPQQAQEPQQAAKKPTTTSIEKAATPKSDKKPAQRQTERETPKKQKQKPQPTQTSSGSDSDFF